MGQFICSFPFGFRYLAHGLIYSRYSPQAHHLSRIHFNKLVQVQQTLFEMILCQLTEK